LRGAAAASFRSSRAQHPSRPAGTHHAAPMTQSARAREMPKLANANGSTWLNTSCQFALAKALESAAVAADPDDAILLAAPAGVEFHAALKKKARFRTSSREMTEKQSGRGSIIKVRAAGAACALRGACATTARKKELPELLRARAASCTMVLLQHKS
jgi:hypothetical protein